MPCSEHARSPNLRFETSYLHTLFFVLLQCWIETHEARNVLYRNAKTLEVSGAHLNTIFRPTADSNHFPDVRPKTAPSLRPPPPAPPVDVAHMAQPMPAPPSRKSIHLKSSSPMVSFRDNYDEPDAPPPPVRVLPAKCTRDVIAGSLALYFMFLAQQLIVASRRLMTQTCE